MKKQSSLNRRGIAVLDRRPWLVTILMVLAVTAAAALSSGRTSAQTSQDKDFFGTVVSVEKDRLLVSRDSALVAVVITPDTKVRLPLQNKAKVTDLVQGDRVAVSLVERGGRLVADKVFLVPDKPRYRHVPGTVVNISLNEITIQPPDANAQAIGFAVAGNTPVRFRQRVTSVADVAQLARADAGTLVDRFVVVSVVTHPDSLSEAIEILVTEGKPAAQQPATAPATVTAQAAERVELRGVFSGVDREGNWLIGGTTVKVDPEVAVDRGLAVGQAVEVKARVGADGTLYAMVVRREDGDDASITQRVRMEGIFQGLDNKGRWLIGGTAVNIGPRSNTDGLPYQGQRVRAIAIRQEDGALEAVAVDNLGRSRNAPMGLVYLQGTLEGIDRQGKWTVSGVGVSVGPSTKLEDSPAVGQPVQVRAVREADGSLLAQEIKARNEEITSRRGQAKIMGVVQQVLEDGRLIINGVTVSRSALTEQEGFPQAGDLVLVEAVLLEDGTLLAREIHLGRELDGTDATGARESGIRGTIERTNPDGILVVNGITVVVGSLTEVKVDLTEGTVVKVEGILQSDGSLLARKVTGEVPTANWGSGEAKVGGQIGKVERNRYGEPVGVVIDGARIALGPLTRLDESPEEGTEIEATGIVKDGLVLASRIRARKSESQKDTREFRLEGRVESLWKNEPGSVTKFSVNGLTIRILPTTEVDGTLNGGELVEVHGALRNGTVVATKVKKRQPPPAAVERTEFHVTAPVTAVRAGPRGRLQRLVVDDRTIAVEALTDIESGVAVGRVVKVDGVVIGGTYVATKVRLEDLPQSRRKENSKKDKEEDRKEDRDD